MRICSLLPSATEMLFALGLDEEIVGVSHECDFPPQARQKPRVVQSVIDQDQLSSEAIDHLVLDHLRRRDSLYRVDVELLKRLQPDVIVTQELCDVCAVDVSTVHAAITALSSRPDIVALHPHTLTEMLNEILAVGKALGRKPAALQLVETLQTRIEHVKRCVADATTRPRVVCLEWLKPLMGCGHWVPEMVELAGGQEVVGKAGEPSRAIEWPRVVEAQPDVLVMMPCGFPIERTKQELDILLALPGWHGLPAVTSGRVYLVNGPAYYNRSGPRLVDGLEILAQLFHPQRCHGFIKPGDAQRWGGV